MYIRHYGKQYTSPTMVSRTENELTMSYKFLCLKERAKMSYLPKANKDQEKGLSHCPPQNPRIGTLTCCTKPILAPLQHRHWTTISVYNYGYFCDCALHCFFGNVQNLIETNLLAW